MSGAAPNGETLGWIGVGRMGEVLAGRLLDQGCDLTVYNRTSAKAKPLVDRGARLVEHAVEPFGPRHRHHDGGGVERLRGGHDRPPRDCSPTASRAPGLVVDASTVSMEISERDSTASRRSAAWRSWPLRSVGIRKRRGPGC